VRAEPSKLFNADPGGQPLIRSDVTRGVAASRKFAASRDLPDVLGFEDLAYAPDATYELALRRVLAGVAFTDATPFPLSKGDGHATRPMTVMNPLDELALRAFVGRCSMAIRAATGSDALAQRADRASGPGVTSTGLRSGRSGSRTASGSRPLSGPRAMFDAWVATINLTPETAAP
jgi:hypothetical protein